MYYPRCASSSSQQPQQHHEVPVKVADIDNEMVERVMSSLLSSIHHHAIPSIATTLMEMDGSGVTVILPFSLIDIILAYNLSFGKLIHTHDIRTCDHLLW
jgi:hypothetical protein